MTATVNTSGSSTSNLDFTYVWENDGVIVQTTSNTSSLTDTLDLSVPGNGDKGDVITVLVTPSVDGVSGAVASGSVTVADSPPTASVSLSPANPTSTSTLTATVSASDPDNDPLSFTYIWEQDGNVVASTSGTSSTTETLDLSSLAGVDNNDVISVEVIPNDGTTNGAMATAEAVVSETAPVVTVSLAPLNPTTNQTLTATATAFDPGGNPVMLTYVWTVNGNTVQTTSNTTALTDTLDLSIPGNGDKGDVIAVTVTPDDGVYTGTTVTASTTVADSAPTATVSLAPANPTIGQTLTATATDHDDDGDLVLLTYVWTQNGNIVQTTSNTTALTDTLDLTILTNVNVGDVFSVQVTPYDRTDYGLPAIASATVGASVPVAQDGNASISHRSATGVDITLQGTDSDNAPLTFNLFGGLNGGAQHGTATPVSGTTNEFLYVPTGTYIGTDSFQFTATAGGLTSQPATVTIDLTNALPVVADFTPSTFATENQTLVVTAPNLRQVRPTPTATR